MTNEKPMKAKLSERCRSPSRTSRRHKSPLPLLGGRGLGEGGALTAQDEAMSCSLGLDTPRLCDHALRSNLDSLFQRATFDVGRRHAEIRHPPDSVVFRDQDRATARPRKF